MSHLESDSYNSSLIHIKVSHAVKYGSDGAVMISLLQSTNSPPLLLQEMCKIFPFWTESRIERIIFKLIEFEIIEKIHISEEFAIEILKKKIPSKFRFYLTENLKRCEWCLSETLHLHDHHWPIRKSYGGKEVISICPNCHQEFHYLVDYPKYQFIPNERRSYDL